MEENNKRMKILLVCFGGFSTSLLISRLQKHLAPYGIDAVSDAEPLEKGMKSIGKYDVLLVAPQVKYMLEPLKEEAAKHNVPVIPIAMNEYAKPYPEELIRNIVKVSKGEWTDV